MSVKVEDYSINLSSLREPEIVQLAQNLNRIFRMQEDRLDEMEAVRGSQYFNTYRWELEYVKEE